ncbi:hypothetical protein MK805_13010 [Shimazuella sp. AN120528]|uniref:hypothetical protein n=1 Tax=Shimazuella soli TaxID=1892854 RepID=UPI001F112FB5|nr:hypothetical protein [Shimazuella soli]MCH5585862.1 hypothetical protein [Shimazuella soli]
MTWKERSYGNKVKRETLRKLILEGQKLEQDNRFVTAKERRKAVREKRREAQELRKQDCP